MSAPRAIAVGLIVVGMAAGTSVDRSRVEPPLEIGGYRVIAADFHTHSSMWSNGLLTPWGLVLEAERQGLDAVAITGHNELWDARVGRWFSEQIGGPTVIVGEEITSDPHFHMIALGVPSVVPFGQSAVRTIDQIHREGGIAIAAHPVHEQWNGYRGVLPGMLDGAEVCHPVAYATMRAASDLDQFFGGVGAAAIGSSDYHGTGWMGVCRTYVFARDDSADAILDAIRHHRTVVYGAGDRVYGDAAFVELAAEHNLGGRAPSPRSRGTWADWLSQWATLAGLAGLAVA